MIKLFPYQIIGAEWLASKRAACLFDEMGIGKSAQAIHACELVGAKQILVICRAVARSNWQNEFRKFSSISFDLTITSYESLHKVDVSKQFDVLIIDESHYVKEPGAQRTASVLGKTGAIHRARRTFFLTGTPTPNHAGELWTTLYTLGRTRLSYENFIQRYCTSRITTYGRQITGTNVEQARLVELRECLNPISLRRTKEDVNLQLPPIFYSDITVKPGKVDLLMCQTFRKWVVPVDHSKELEVILNRELGIINGIVEGGFTDLAMKALEANAKSIMTVRRYNSMQKVEPVAELVAEELENNAYQKIVIFAIHRDTIVTIQERLAKRFGAVLVFGGSKPSRVTDRIHAFQTKGKCRVFVAQIQTAGTSLTLTAADQVLFVDQSFVPGDNHQAAARCHRIGQTKPVTVRFVSLADSIDQHIAAILRRKTAEISELMDGVTGQRKTILRKAKNVTELL